MVTEFENKIVNIKQNLIDTYNTTIKRMDIQSQASEKYLQDFLSTFIKPESRDQNSNTNFK